MTVVHRFPPARLKRVRLSAPGAVIGPENFEPKPLPTPEYQVVQCPHCGLLLGHGGTPPWACIGCCNYLDMPPMPILRESLQEHMRERFGRLR